MMQSGFISIGRVRLFCFAIVLSAISCAAFAQDPAPVDAGLHVESVRLGYSGRYRPGRLTPVFVKVSNSLNTAANVQVRVIHSDSDGDDVEWISDAPLAASQSRWVNVIIRPGENLLWSRKVKLAMGVVDGDDFKPVEAFELSSGGLSKIGGLRLSPLDGNTVAVAVISNSAGAMSVADSTAESKSSEGARKISVFAVSPETLGSDWRALDMLDVIFWEDPELSSLSGEVQEAIVQWVRRGGKLVVTLGPRGMQLNGARESFRRMMPVRVNRTSVKVSDIGVLNKYLGGNVMLGVGSEKNICDMKVLRGATAAKSGKLPLLCRAQHYGGQVSVLAGRLIDFGYDKYADRPVGSRMMRRLIGFDGIYSTEQPIHMTFDVNGMLRPPAIGSLLIALALVLCFVYVLAAGPGSWMILKRKKATRLAWWVFGAVAILASGGFAVLARFGISEASANYVAIADIENKSNYANIRGYCGVYLPRHGTAEVSLSDDYYASLCPMISDDVSTLSGYADVRKYSMKQSTPHTMSPFFRRTVKRMAFNYSGGLDGDISASLKLTRLTRDEIDSLESIITGDDSVSAAKAQIARWKLSGKIDNTLGYDLQNPTLIYLTPEGRLAVAVMKKIGKSSIYEFASHIDSGTPDVALFPAAAHFRSLQSQIMSFHGGDKLTAHVLEAGSCMTLLSAELDRIVSVNASDVNMLDRSDMLENGYAIFMAKVPNASDILPMTVDGNIIKTNGELILRMMVPVQVQR